MPVFPSEEWLAACRETINSDEDLARAGRNWVGSLVLHLKPERGSRIGAELYAILELAHGACRDARVITPEEASEAQYVISGPYFTWKHIITGEIDPVAAVARRAVRGNLFQALRHAHAIRLLAQAAARVPGTEYIDEITPERVRALSQEGWPVHPDF